MATPSVVSFNTYDGSISAFQYLYPTLKAEGWRGVAFIIPELAGAIATKMSEAQLRVLANWGWDISYHGNSAHNLPLLSDEDLHREVYGKRDWLVRHGFPRGARHAAPYLFHVHDREYAALVAAGFESIIADTDPFTIVPNASYTLVRLNACDATPVGDVTTAITTASTTPGTILCLESHGFVASGAVGLETSQARLDIMVAAIKATTLEVVTFSDLME